MADKLSERLEAEAARTKPAWTKAPTMDPPTKPVHDARVQALLREAAELARRVEGAPLGTIDSVSFEEARPVWQVMDDREAVPLNEPRRVRLVPEPPEVG